jgi:hypothetical protein
MKVNNAQNLRLGFNLPLVSRANLLVNIEGFYYETWLNVAVPPRRPEALGRGLAQAGLRSTGLAVMVFKPLNEIHFLIFTANADLNGNFGWSRFRRSSALTYSGLAMFGAKLNPRTMTGLGFMRTFRFGEPVITPVLLHNQTFNDRWGTELLLPIRGCLRRSFSTRSLAKFGYDIESNRYLFDLGDDPPQARIFRGRYQYRSEVRIGFAYERALYRSLWVTAQAGWRYNVSFGDYDLGHPLYFGFGLSLAKP